MKEKEFWAGVDPGAQKALAGRDYRVRSLTEEWTNRGVDAGKLVMADRKNHEIQQAWIPGVEIFSRTIHSQRHRGFFGEFVRCDERSEERRVGKECRSRWSPYH